MTNSTTTRMIMSETINGRPHELPLRKSVIHPNHGIRMTTLPITRFSGTPCPVPQSVLESYSVGEGVAGHFCPLPSPFVWK